MALSATFAETETAGDAGAGGRSWVATQRGQHLAFAALLVATAAVRCGSLDRPLVGHFATKNVVYAMIARNWANGLAPAWYPTLDCLKGGQRAWHLLEVPLAAYAAGLAWKSIGPWTGGGLEFWGRLVSVLASVGAVAVMFRLVRRWHGTAAAWGAAVALALAPVSVIFGQMFMLEASIVLLTLSTLAAWQQWLDQRRTRWLLVAGFCWSLLLLSKVYMIVLLLPLASMAWRQTARCRADPAAAAVLVAASLPALVWVGLAWTQSDPAGPHAARVYYSLRDSAGVHGFPQSMLTSLDFYRTVLDHLTGVGLTPLGFVLALVGLLDGQWRRHVAWLASSGVLLAAMPLKFVHMPYYWLVALPPLCVLVGLGWRIAWRRLALAHGAVAVVVLLALLFSLRYAARPAFAIPYEDRGVVAAGRAVDRHAAAGDRLVSMHGSTIDLLYYSGRIGWAVAPDSPDLPRQLAEARRHGARWLVVANLASVAPSSAAQRELAALRPVDQGDDWRLYLLGDDVAQTADSRAESRR